LFDPSVYVNLLWVEMVERKIKVRVIIEVIGGPKEHVEKTLGLVLNKIKEEKYLEVIKAVSYEAKQTDKKFWSSFAELELSFSNVERVIDFCFDYMPSSIEIVEPTELMMETKEISNMLNDLLAGLHKYELALKNIHAQNILLKRELDKKKG